MFAWVQRTADHVRPGLAGRHGPEFIDLDALAVSLASLAPHARRVLEIGCGDGSLARAMWWARYRRNDELRRRTFGTVAGAAPVADLSYLGIDDSSDGIGARFDGDPRFARFRSMSSESLIAERQRFGLVVVRDLVHHLPQERRYRVIGEAAALTAPGGTLAVKEWTASGAPGNLAAGWLDRIRTGDREMRFMPRGEIVNLIESATPEDQGWVTTAEVSIPPRRANILITRRKIADP